MSGPVPAAARLVRFGEWWHHKLPPLFAIAYLLLAEGSVPLPRAATLLALFLGTSVGTAAFGHLLNDLTDLASDRAAGVRRPLHALAPATRLGLVLLALAAAIAPWLWLPRDAWNLSAFALELALLAAYSLPPLRLKERGLAGVVADALYGHALPMVVVLATFRLATGLDRPWFRALAGALVLWKLAQGLCGALVGQIRGRRADRRSGTRTWVARVGPRRALGWVNRLLLPLQGIAFLAVCALVAWRHPWFAPAYPLFLAGRLWEIRRVWRKPRSFFRRSYPGYVLLNDFHELWMPLLLLVPLLARDAAFAALLAAHLLLFRTALSRAAAELVRRLRGAR